MSDRGVLTVISGFSGAGKGTVVKQLLQEYDYGLSISATTRSPGRGSRMVENISSKQKKSLRK